MNTADLTERYFNIVRREGLEASPVNLRIYLDYLFRGVNFVDKTVLDVGSGFGLFGFYAGSRGARRVVCLEPEGEGSHLGTLEKFRELTSLFGSDQVRLHSVRFQEFDAGSETFDIILLHNSINHLDEIACINLKHDTQALEDYRMMFRALGGLARNGAKLIITDCSRYNIFPLLNLRNPFVPTIEWSKHQSPRLWAKLLAEAGFRNPKIRWTSPSRLRSLGRILMGNKIAAFFHQSHFCLTMERSQFKPAGSPSVSS